MDPAGSARAGTEPAGSAPARSAPRDGAVPDPAALLLAAVSVPSPSGAEGDVVRLLVDAARPSAREAFADEAGNAVALFGSGPLRVTFLGHVDTAPGFPPPRLEGGAVWGRGSVDAKGPFVAALCAAARLSDAALSRMTLRLIGAVEEEAPSSRGARHAVRAYEAPDLLLIGEPSGWDAVTLGYKGRLVLRVRSAKPDFHSAGDGTTAAEDVAAAWEAVRSWARGAAPEDAGPFDRVQAALQAIEGGTDGLEQRASATIGLRLPPAWPPVRARAALAGLALPHGVTVEASGDEVPVRGPRDTPLTRAFRTAIRELGGRPRTKVKTGTSDMNVVVPVWDRPVLAYGPGDSALDHAPDERVEVDELRRATEVMRRALERIAADAG